MLKSMLRHTLHHLRGILLVVGILLLSISSLATPGRTTSAQGALKTYSFPSGATFRYGASWKLETNLIRWVAVVRKPTILMSFMEPAYLGPTAKPGTSIEPMLSTMVKTNLARHTYNAANLKKGRIGGREAVSYLAADVSTVYYALRFKNRGVGVIVIVLNVGGTTPTAELTEAISFVGTFDGAGDSASYVPAQLGETPVVPRTVNAIPLKSTYVSKAKVEFKYPATWTLDAKSLTATNKAIRVQHNTSNAALAFLEPTALRSEVCESLVAVMGRAADLTNARFNAASVAANPFWNRAGAVHTDSRTGELLVAVRFQDGTAGAVVATGVRPMSATLAAEVYAMILTFRTSATTSGTSSTTCEEGVASSTDTASTDNSGNSGNSGSRENSGSRDNTNTSGNASDLPNSHTFTGGAVVGYQDGWVLSKVGSSIRLSKQSTTIFLVEPTVLKLKANAPVEQVFIAGNTRFGSPIPPDTEMVDGEVPGRESHAFHHPDTSSIIRIGVVIRFSDGTAGYASIIAPRSRWQGIKGEVMAILASFDNS